MAKLRVRLCRCVSVRVAEYEWGFLIISGRVESALQQFTQFKATIEIIVGYIITSSQSKMYDTGWAQHEPSSRYILVFLYKYLDL